MLITSDMVGKNIRARSGNHNHGDQNCWDNCFKITEEYVGASKKPSEIIREYLNKLSPMMNSSSVVYGLAGIVGDILDDHEKRCRGNK